MEPGLCAASPAGAGSVARDVEYSAVVATSSTSTPPVDSAAVHVAVAQAQALDAPPMVGTIVPAQVGVARAGHLTVCGVICSRFCILQTIFNTVASFLGPLMCFWYLFSPTEGGSTSYNINSGPVMGAIVASPFASAVFSLAFAPLSMLEAVDNGWFGTIRPADPGLRRASRLLCYLGEGRVWRRAFTRHALLGGLIAPIWIPAGLSIAGNLVADEHGDIQPWPMIIFSVTYIATIPPVVSRLRT
jgi:hypothetical protein